MSANRLCGDRGEELLFVLEVPVERHRRHTVVLGKTTNGDRRLVLGIGDLDGVRNDRVGLQSFLFLPGHRFEIVPVVVASIATK